MLQVVPAHMREPIYLMVGARKDDWYALITAMPLTLKVVEGMLGKEIILILTP